VEYTRLCNSVKDFGKLIPVDSFGDYFAENCNPSKDWYRSLFNYNETQYKRFKETQSVSGIRDVQGTRLFFDFDSKKNQEQARIDANTLCKNLILMGISDKALQICFSGNKGFSVELETGTIFTLSEYKNVYTNLIKDLPTADAGVTIPTQLVRMPFTKHPETGLYKIPLTYDQLCNLTMDEIKKRAKTNDYTVDWWETDLPEQIIKLKDQTATHEEPKITKLIDIEDIDFLQKPHWMSNCKYALLHGHFKTGTRSNALMALCATYKAQGFPADVTESILTSVSHRQAKREKSSPFPIKDIKKNIIDQVYSAFWSGGQYSCKTTPWLKKICDSLGDNKCKEKDNKYSKLVVDIKDVTGMFQKYAKDIDKNTIKLGIPQIDEKLHLTIGMPVGLLGAPASGKTSVGLEILAYNSRHNIKSMFFSMDMYAPIVYQKQIQRLTGYGRKQIYRLTQENGPEIKKIYKQLEEEYKNVKYCFQSGLHVDEIRKAIVKYKEEVGDALKLVVIDYHECIGSPFSDFTTRSGDNANRLKDIANELDICLVNIVQPPKSAGDPSEPLTSMRQVKGSSLLEQSFRVILGIYREGYDIYNPDDDRFITFNCLKNTMGSLFSTDCSWHGRRGKIDVLEESDKTTLHELREGKREKKDKDNDW
jgi:hypothetical protein